MQLLLTFYVAIFTLFSCSLQAKVKHPLPLVHVIGDSHSHEFDKIPGCVVHWVGPVTMHRVGRDGLFSLNIANMGIQDGEAVVFAFGEIDVRCHIGKQRDLHMRSVEETINTLVHTYLYRILELRAFYPHLICIVYSVTPPTDRNFVDTYPCYGFLEDRVCITRLLNAKLAEVCQQQGLCFLDVYDDYVEVDGTLKIVLSDGNVHIHPDQCEPIQKKLNKILKKATNLRK